MRLRKLCIAALSICSIPALAGVNAAVITGRATYTGTPAKAEAVNMAKQPECVKLYSKPLMTERVVTGPGNSLQNVVVYISAGLSESSAAPATPVTFDQQGCRYTTHVLAFRVGQDVKISNRDPFSHNIHPVAKINREWNRMQPPGTPPFSYAYEQEEFIPVKCNIHSWMQAYFVPLKTSHFAVTGEDGQFRLPELPAGKFTIAGSETQTVNFTFKATL